MAGKTLIVLKGQDNFEFFFEDYGESRYWRVRDHPDFPGWFTTPKVLVPLSSPLLDFFLYLYFLDLEFAPE